MKSYILKSLLIIVPIVLSSCEADIVHEEVAAVFDKSESQDGLNNDPQSFLRILIDEDRLIETGNSFTFYIVECGSKPIPNIDKVRLDGANMLIKPKHEREEDVARFVLAASSKLDTLLSKAATHSQSQIYRTFTHTVNNMDHSADVRRIYFRSDFLEFSPITNWERAKDLDFETETEKLFADQPLPESVNGLEVILITENTSEQSLKAVRIWLRMLQEAGAIVKVQSSFINS
jgi:hypothetical protein